MRLVVTCLLFYLKKLIYVHLSYSKQVSSAICQEHIKPRAVSSCVTCKLCRCLSKYAPCRNHFLSISLQIAFLLVLKGCSRIGSSFVSSSNVLLFSISEKDACSFALRNIKLFLSSEHFPGLGTEHDETLKLLSQTDCFWRENKVDASRSKSGFRRKLRIPNRGITHCEIIENSSFSDSWKTSVLALKLLSMAWAVNKRASL